VDGDIAARQTYRHLWRCVLPASPEFELTLNFPAPGYLRIRQYWLCGIQHVWMSDSEILLMYNWALAYARQFGTYNVAEC